MTGRKVVPLDSARKRPRSCGGVSDADVVRAFMGSYRFNADGQLAPASSYRRAVEALARLVEEAAK